ncbi:MAG TPA: EAL domain-containing protein [Alphaproteobacteria bacterium]|jgi:sensor c-di-GMP phosphodiesterase-like protein
MTARRRREGQVRRTVLILGLIVVGLAPFLSALLLAYAFAVDQVRTDLSRAAGAAFTAADGLLEKSLAELIQLQGLAGARCDDSVIRRLRDRVYRSTVVREIDLFDANLRPYCSNFGLTSLAYDGDEVRKALNSGVFLRVVDATALHDQSVVLFYRLPGGHGLSAAIHPNQFVERLDVAASSEGTYLSLSLADGTPIASRMPQDTSPIALTSFVGRSGARFSLVASAAADRRLVWRGFEAVVPAFAGVGLLLSAVLLWLIVRIMRRRTSLEVALQAAIKRGELEVHYLPTIDLTTNRCIGGEALVRWRHPERGLLPPAAFIGLAEETGLIIQMTRWLLRQVTLEIASRFRGGAGMHFGVNLTAQHFWDDQIVSEVHAALAAVRLPPSTLVLEATERQMVDDGYGEAAIVMSRLRALGCAIAVDDFGTGHNGLAFLQKFDLDYVKIDKLFVETIGTDAVSRPVLDAIIDLGQRLGVTLIAEGVETPDQLAYLRDRGVRYAQGFLFAKPMPFAAFAKFVERYNRGAADATPQAAPALGHVPASASI